MKPYTTLGKRIPRADALAKVTGEAKYVADVKLPRMLYGKILWSSHPHAVILKIDTSEAERLPGVRAVALLKSPGDKVRYHGESVAAIAADNVYIAEEAVNLICVDYQELPAVFDPLTAMKPDAPLIHERNPGNVSASAHHGYGDVEAGFREADFVFENTFKVGMAHQGYMETHGAVAQVESSGDITVWATTQGHFGIQSGLAQMFGVPASKIRVIPMEVGGAFGGKTSMSVEPACVMLSRKCHQPVKIILTRTEDFICSRPGPACVAELKIGVKKDGTLTAMEVKQIWDAGAYGGVFVSSFPRTRGLYKIPNLKVDIVSIFTNKLMPGAYRGPAAPEMTFPIESQMDIIVSELGIDPIEFRMKNAVDEGDLDVNRVPYRRIGFKTTLQKAAEYLNSHRSQPEKKDRAYGLGIACGKWINAIGTSGIYMKINEDGRISMLTGSVDLTGVRTVFAQMAAEELGIPVDMIDVVVGDTLTAPAAALTGGSRTTYGVGMAVRRAADDFKAQLLNAASQILDEDVDKLEYADGKVFVKGTSRCATIQEIGLASLYLPSGPVVGRGTVSSPEWLSKDPSFITQIAEVEVDTATGEVKLVKFVCVQDTGLAVNMMSLEGQLQGGAAQGIGWAIMEKMVFHDGVLLNPNFMDYSIPTSLDIPPIEPIVVEVPSSEGPYGLRGAAEMPMIPVLATVANAIHAATGVRIREIPITREKILEALK